MSFSYAPIQRNPTSIPRTFTKCVDEPTNTEIGNKAYFTSALIAVFRCMNPFARVAHSIHFSQCYIVTYSDNRRSCIFDVLSTDAAGNETTDWAEIFIESQPCMLLKLASNVLNISNIFSKNVIWMDNSILERSSKHNKWDKESQINLQANVQMLKKSWKLVIHANAKLIHNFVVVSVSLPFAKYSQAFIPCLCCTKAQCLCFPEEKDKKLRQVFCVA